ncbi:hypothetical protein F5141DRAFT_1294198 [Pisolithus sp. B1]|nr:hypothetical protein F5141DRAFT_1294198 [Pisolithus sp. B1]
MGVVKDRRTLEPLLPDMDSMKSSPFGEQLSAFQLSAVQKEFFLNAISDMRADVRDASPEEQEEAIRKRILDGLTLAAAVTRCDITLEAHTPDSAELVGTDLRYLAYAGYPTLYGDRDFCKIRFFPGDILQLENLASTDPNNDHSLLKDVNKLSQLCARVEKVSQIAWLPSWMRERRQAGPSFFGRQLGRVQEGPLTDNSPRYIHSPASWERMWRRVLGEDTNIEVVATLRPLEDPSLYWSVWIEKETFLPG